VHPAHDEEGIGDQLLEWVEGYAISTGAIRLEVVVEEENERALTFYRGRGFATKVPGLLELVLPQA
jgi:ribosomal protein S18 acetylase RimI-like enzyme